MTLTAGTKLGRYEIRSKIGEGGMGKVYRAYDPAMHREVAIKLLAAELSTDKGRLARFEQEAQTAGALNHSSVSLLTAPITAIQMKRCPQFEARVLQICCSAQVFDNKPTECKRVRVTQTVSLRHVS
jgi:serine/threonine protein kinase